MEKNGEKNYANHRIDIRNPLEVLTLKQCRSVDQLFELLTDSASKILLDLDAGTFNEYDKFLEIYEDYRDRILICLNFANYKQDCYAYLKKNGWCDLGDLLVLYNVNSNYISEACNSFVSEGYAVLYSYTEDVASKYYNYEYSGILLDIVLQSGSNISIFEHHAVTRLETELTSKSPDATIDSTELNGFKITDSHIRIGSKIHISNFYFAKRFFQNGYYATRFAYLIVRTILDVHIPKIVKSMADAPTGVGEPGITLFGYGLYSEMMVSTVKDILIDFNLRFPINHDLISDEEALDRIRPFEQIYRHAILIIPIASTFGTSLKIEDLLKNTLSVESVLEPHLNVINVFNNSEKKNPEEVSIIEKKFSWDKIKLNERSVYLKTEDGKSLLKEQRYYIRLPTKWYDVKNCHLCFSNPSVKEVPLFITDKTSVTPILIFDMPRGRILKSNNSCILSQDMLKYGHFSGHFNHNLYYINRELFFEKNKESIKQWLIEIKQKNSELYDDVSPITIISPGHHSNVGFAKLVNEILFTKTGNIIHYDPNGDHAQNFNTFFGSDIRANLEKSKLFFVDDMLVSGMAFSNCVNFLKYTREDYKGFDGCITLIDRSNDFVQKNVLQELGMEKQRFISYTDLLLTSIYHLDDVCPICTEKERYDQLTAISWLDKTQLHFLKQSNKLALKSPSQTPNVDVKSDTYVRRVEATHRIYYWFYLLETGKVNGLDHFPKFKNWVDNVIESTPAIFNQTTLLDNDDETIAETFIKVLTQSPMTHYKPVKIKAFSWLLSELDNHIKKISQQISLNELTYVSFRRLKFLIRRAGLLQSNYLISHNLLDLLNELYGANGISRLLQEQNNRTDDDPKVLEKKLLSLKTFFVFYTAQIKELLFLNESRSIKLEKNISKYLSEKNINPGFEQVLRILREENGVLITSFLDYLTLSSHWNDELTESESNKGIQNLLTKPTLQEHFRYKDLEDFLTIDSAKYKKTGLANNKDFVNFLYLHNFLGREKYKEQNLDSKTDMIMTKLRQIVFDDNLDSGAFLSVIYKRSGVDNLFFAYNKGTRGIIREFQAQDSNNYFCKFLYGIKDNTGESDITITEFYKNLDGVWLDLYSDTQIKNTNTDFGRHLIPSEYNRILLLRINKRSTWVGGKMENTPSSQAIVGFYSKQSGTRPTDMSKIRFLLLLRPYISAFIENHHENNEFKDWMDAMVRRRTSLLTGHGRDMLMNLVRINSNSEKINYQNILLTILLTQKTLLDEMDLKRFGNGRDFVGLKNFLNLNSDMVDSFYCEDTLKAMAEEIFLFSIIENEEDVEEHVNFKASPFNFSKQILECICFELFINAKKNRFVFLKDQKVASTQNRELIFDKNVIWIDVTDFGDREVEIKISNTGPNMPEQLKIDLQNNYNIKDTGEIGGLEMISTILDRFSLGKLRLEDEFINEGQYLSKFICSLKLKVKHEH